MARLNPTDEQRVAICGRGSMLVSAAAGSGKTAVLVERVIGRILDENNPVDADRLLVVTFTNAAAAEMKQRINARLSDELAAHPDNARLIHQQILLSKANICTIDSFCINLLREHFELAGLTPDFRLCSTGHQRTIESAAMNEVLTRHFESGDPLFLKLISLLGQATDDSPLTTAIQNIYDYQRTIPFPHLWSARALQAYAELSDVTRSRFGEILFTRARESVNSVLSILENALLSMNADPEVESARGDTLREQLTVFESASKLIESRDWDGLYALIPSLTQKPGWAKKLPRSCTSPAKDAAEWARSCAQRTGGELANWFGMSSEECRAHTEAIMPSVRLLLDLVDEYTECASAMKRAEKCIDFADSEKMVLSLLAEEQDGAVQPTDFARALYGRFDEVMLDEFQDVNDLQSMIFNLLSQDGARLFAVGDIKQSIYAFRKANPENFLNFWKKCTPYDGQHFPAAVTLSRNFRSRKGICEIINFCFGMLMSEPLGGICYREGHELVPGADFPPREGADVHYRLIPGDNGSDERIEKEADAIAAIIHERMQTPCLSDGHGGLRKAEYRDFAVLLRVVAQKALPFCNRLRLHGIPCVTETTENFLETPEIMQLLAILRAINNPLDDVALFSAMLSPAFGFTQDDIARIRKNRREPLFLSVSAAAGEPQCKQFLETLETLRRDSCSLPVDRLIDRIFDITGFLSLVQASESGNQKRSTLLCLRTMAGEYKTGILNRLSGFLQYIDHLNESGGIQAPQESRDNCVRVMSIHRSKGLQFPICFIPQLSHPLNSRHGSRELLLDAGCGIGLQAGKQYTPIASAIALLNEKSAYAEALRLLYVAMTRAQEELYLVDCRPYFNTALKTAAGILESENGAPGDAVSVSSLLSCKSFSDWLLLCAMSHPSGSVLRDLSEIPLNPAPCSTPFDITCSDAVTEPLPAATGTEDDLHSECSDELYGQLLERMNYVNPYRALAGMASKRSVSRLSHAEADRRNICTARPAFLQEDGLSSTERGTAMHEFMQYANYAAAKNDLQGEIDRLTARGFLSQRQRDAILYDRLAAFFQSPLYARMERSPRLMREQRFLSELPAREVENQLPAEFDSEKIVVQGIADCIFEEDGGLVIVDYKTDHVEDPLLLAEHYREQLALYARAFSLVYSLPVRQKLLYSFYTDQAIEV